MTIPVMSWLKSYLHFSSQYGYSMHSDTEVPVAWLYDPAGEPVKFFTQSQTTQLRTTMSNFPKSLTGAKALAQEPGLEATKKILRKANGENAKVNPMASQWTVVLMFPKAPGKKCMKCADFLHPMEAAAKRSNGKLYLVTVWLTIGSSD